MRIIFLKLLSFIVFAICCAAQEQSEQEEDQPIAFTALQNGQTLRQATQGQNSSGSTVVIYKGSLPWAPLTKARAFGLKTDQRELGREGPGLVPVQPAETISEQNDAFEASGEQEEGTQLLADEKPELLPSTDYIDPDSKAHIRADLHASLRQPLKRLSDRQLSLLLKQIRKQRRRQQGTENNTAGEDGREVQESREEHQSRQEMLSELRQLLRSPPEGQKLLRPKLLTNINVVPSEWAIYPAKHIAASDQQSQTGGEGGEGNANHKLADQAAVAATEQISGLEEDANAGGNETSNKQQPKLLVTNGTIYFGEENDQTNHTKEEPSGQEIREEATTEATKETEQKKDATAENTTESTITATKSTDIGIASSTITATSDETTAVNLPGPRPGEVHFVGMAPLEDGVNNSIDDHHQRGSMLNSAVEVTTDSALINQTENDGKLQPEVLTAHQQLKQEKQLKSAERSAEEGIAKLTAHWRVVEQKFAAEMQTALVSASQAITKTERRVQQSDESNEQLLKSNISSSSNSVAFSSKNWQPTNGSISSSSLDEPEEKIPINSSSSTTSSPETLSPSSSLAKSTTTASLADLERNQLAELSTQLREIRLRYEAVKRQFLAKLRQLNSRRAAASKKLRKFKAAAAATFVDGAELTELKAGSESNETTGLRSSVGEGNAEQKKPNEQNQKEEEAKHPDVQTEEEERKRKQLRVEELRKEEELAKKVLSGEIDEEEKHGHHQRQDKPEKLEEKITSDENATTGILAITEASSNHIDETTTATTTTTTTLNTSTLEANKDEVSLNATIAINETASEVVKTNENSSIQPNSTTQQNGSFLNKETEGKRKKKLRGKKMPTLAELAEELNRVDEKMIERMLASEHQQQANETQSEIKIGSNQDKLEEKKVSNRLKTPQQQQPKRNQRVHQDNDHIVHPRRNKTAKVQKQQQQKNSSNLNSNNSSATATNSSFENTLIKTTVATPISLQNGQDNNTSETADFLHRAGLPASPIRPIPTPTKRILTADWLPRAKIDPPIGAAGLIRGQPGGGAQEKTIGTAEGKKTIGRMGPIVMTRHRDQPQQQQQNATSQQQQQQLGDPAQQKVLLKRPRLNQSAAIGTRLPLAGPRRLPTGNGNSSNIGQLPQNDPLKDGQRPRQPKQQQQQRQQQSGQNGFYQLDRAQISNVGQKIGKPSQAGELKLKGVSQVQVEASKDPGGGEEQPAEMSAAQLKAKLKEEQQLQAKLATNKKGKGEETTGDDLNNLEEFARLDEQANCEAIACNFETGTLCEWEPSVDELNPEDPRYRRYMMARHVLLLANKMRMRRRRSRRDTEAETTTEEKKLPAEINKRQSKNEAGKKGGDGKVVLRSWHNWVGRYRNRLTGIARAEIFSTRNQRFAASYVRPGQRSTLTGRLLSGETATIRFRVWEATRDLQLRVCCDGTDREEQCVFHTDKGIKRGSRRWLERTATCPKGTKKIIFECRNLGHFQGACGLDDIQLLNDYCPAITGTDNNIN